MQYVALLCFDLDGTLCTNTGGEYERAEPFEWAIARVNRLADAGHRILIYTARGTATGIDWEPVTRDQLKRWGVNYHDLSFGKPSAAVFIDDRAVHTEAWRLGSGFGPPALAVPSDPQDGSAEALPTVLAPAVSAVVESGRTFGGEPVRLQQHVARLLELARAAAIRQLPSAAETRTEVQTALAAAQGDHELCYSICISDAPGLMHRHRQASGSAPRLAVGCRTWNETCCALPAMMTAGASAVRATTGEPQPDAWPLHVDRSGAVSAGLGARLCLVAAKEVAIEPAAGLEETAVGWLRELATGLGLAITERDLTTGEVARADEAFLVGLPFCVLGLASADGRLLNRSPGPVTARVTAAWSDAAGTDIGAQLADLSRNAAGTPVREPVSG